MAASPLVAPDTSVLLHTRVAALRDEHARLWRTMPATLPAPGERHWGLATGFFRHRSNARAAARLIDDLSDEGSCLPANDAARRAWQESVRTRVQAFGAERLGWPEGYRRLMFGDAFFTAAGDFARAARAFDPGLSLDDLWQALRNVWIGNGLQMLLDLPVQCTPALFAYSMLYPVTDNMLDDPAIDRAVKRRFNERFGRRLAGFAVAPENAHESAAFELVAIVERQFPRHRCSDVHESLLAIHRGQVRSLTQQSDPAISEAQLLAISCEKGGASVLADLYLVTGDTQPAAAERFAFGYGVALQLMDDLQDTSRDTAAAHQTLFTRAAARGPLDAITSRLLQFIDHAIAQGETLTGDADELDLLRRNCRSLVVGAIAEQPDRFTARFRRRVARQWPLSMRGLRSIRASAERRLPSGRALELLVDGRS